MNNLGTNGSITKAVIDINYEPITCLDTLSFSELVEEITGVSFKDFFSKNVIESETNENY